VVSGGAGGGARGKMGERGEGGWGDKWLGIEMGIRGMGMRP